MLTNERASRHAQAGDLLRLQREDSTMKCFQALALAAVLAGGCAVALVWADDRRPIPTVTLDLGGGVKMEFVRIPKGKFTMGSPEGEKDRDDDEARHEVEITRDFYLGKYEVTQEQYKRVMGENPSYFAAGGSGEDKVSGLDTRRFPVENVSWENAVRFCDKLGEKDRQGRKFRLPSEAEWEYACRAGTTTPFHFGGALNGDKANCEGDFPYGTEEKGRYLKRTCRVGSYAANAFGLYDMHGNVGEWCQDWYGPYVGLGLRDPLRTEKASENGRVLRGGSWWNQPRDCRAAGRDKVAPSYSHGSLGFRVAFRLD
jgi:formylglycine-generating enzyme required for sulfatase activity